MPWPKEDEPDDEPNDVPDDPEEEEDNDDDDDDDANGDDDDDEDDDGDDDDDDDHPEEESAALDPVVRWVHKWYVEFKAFSSPSVQSSGFGSYPSSKGRFKLPRHITTQETIP